MAKKAKEPESAENNTPLDESASEIVPVAKTQIELATEPTEEPSAPAAPPPTKPAGPSFGQRMKRFLFFLLRLVIILVILAALAVGLAYSLPLLYQKYVKPVQDSAAQVTQLKNRIAQNETDIADMKARLGTMQTEQASQAQAIADLEGKVQQIEDQITEHTRSLAALDQMQSELQTKTDATDTEVTRQVKLMKSMELLSRARLFMYQSNFGLARQDVQTARDLLAEVQPSAPEPLALDLAEVIHRLDLTLSNLPGFPVAASDDLDIAWQILLDGQPQPTDTGTATSTPTTPVPEITSTPTPAETQTAEPTATP